MYAIIELGAKQYNIKKDDIIEVEKQVGEKGSEILLDKVLLVADEGYLKVGQPYLKEAKIKAEVLGDFKSKKTIAFMYRRRKAYHKKTGHRQQLTRLKIKEIAIS